MSLMSLLSVSDIQSFSTSQNSWLFFWSIVIYILISSIKSSRSSIDRPYKKTKLISMVIKSTSNIPVMRRGWMNVIRYNYWKYYIQILKMREIFGQLAVAHQVIIPVPSRQWRNQNRVHLHCPSVSIINFKQVYILLQCLFGQAWAFPFLLSAN